MALAAFLAYTWEDSVRARVDFSFFQLATLLVRQSHLTAQAVGSYHGRK